MFKSHPYLRPLLTYTLPPLNLALLTLTILLLHATLHPTTSAPSYFLRSHGFTTFTTLTTVTLAVSALVGLLTALHIHRLLTTPAARLDSLKRTLTLHPPPPLPRLRLHHPFIFLVCATAAGYLLIAQLAFTRPFAEMAWSGTCAGYELMAEVEVLPGWYDGGEDSVLGASSRISYFESAGERVWRETAVREVVRHYRMEPGFNLYRRGSPERERFGDMPGWGLLDVRLVVGSGGEGRYWNATGVGAAGNWTLAGNGTVVGNGNGTEVAARGRVGEVRLDLKSSTYDATYTNTTHPHLTGGYDILPKNLTFPGLRLEHAQPGREWRFTDHVCLPPRVALADPDGGGRVDVRGELGDGCVRYRMCALKRAYPGEGEGEGEEGGVGIWGAWVQDVWPVVTGVVAWEVEKWSACCLRGE